MNSPGPGPNTVPWSTPDLTGNESDRDPFAKTYWNLPVRNSLIHTDHTPTLAVIPSFFSLWQRIS